jgi:hypothetical protein
MILQFHCSNSVEYFLSVLIFSKRKVRITFEFRSLSTHCVTIISRRITVIQCIEILHWGTKFAIPRAQ